MSDCPPDCPGCKLAAAIHELTQLGCPPDVLLDLVFRHMQEGYAETDLEVTIVGGLDEEPEKEETIH